MNTISSINYPDTTPRRKAEEHPMKEGLFASYTEVYEDHFVIEPPLDVALKPGQRREVIESTHNKADAFLTLTNGLRIPLHERDRGGYATAFENFPAGHQAVTAGGEVAAEVPHSRLWMKGDSKLDLDGPRNFTQTILADGTTEFTDMGDRTSRGWEFYTLKPDGSATVAWGWKDRPEPTKATLAEDGSVAFLDKKGVPYKVIMPILPLKHYVTRP